MRQRDLDPLRESPARPELRQPVHRAVAVGAREGGQHEQVLIFSQVEARPQGPATLAFTAPGQGLTHLHRTLANPRVLEGVDHLFAGEEPVPETPVHAGLAPDQVGRAIRPHPDVAIAHGARRGIPVGDLDPLAKGSPGNVRGVGVEETAKDIVPVASAKLELGLLPFLDRLDNVAHPEEVRLPVAHDHIGVAQAQGLGLGVLPAPGPGDRTAANPLPLAFQERHLCPIHAHILHVEHFVVRTVTHHRAVGMLGERGRVLPDGRLDGAPGLQIASVEAEDPGFGRPPVLTGRGQ